MSYLGNLKPLTNKSAKRLGRGIGSGKGGHTVGRGSKGAGARKSSSLPLWFEGGQLPLTKRLPMLRGKARFNVVRPVAQLTLTDLERLPLTHLSLDALHSARLLDKHFHQVKIIATGTLTRALTVASDIRLSQKARQAIEKAGGAIATA
jgi:large subunit ribosomal protein L15